MFCSTIMPGQTPCTSLVVESKRYFVFPEAKYCCMCCTAENGCGILSPNWLVTANGSYVGRKVVEGNLADGWVAVAHASNYYWQTAYSEIPLEIYQAPSDLQVFNVSTFSTRPLSDQLFHLPPSCDGDPKCPSSSFCHYFSKTAPPLRL